MVFQFYNTLLILFNISSRFSGGIIIFATGSCFTIISLLDLVTASIILFPLNSPDLGTTFLKAVFTATTAGSKDCFLYSLANDENHIL